MDGTKLDWATAEALALGSLLAEGTTSLYSCTADRGCRYMTSLIRDACSFELQLHCIIFID